MSRGLRRGIIAALVLVALLVTADRISLVVAEGVAANSIKTSQHLDSDPSVSAKGFPFLTQLVSGHYDEIDVKAHGVEVNQGGHPLRIDVVSVVLHGVHVSHGFSVVRADTATARALISYADLSSTLGSTISYAGAGRVKASASVTVAGVKITGAVSVRPELTSAKTLRFADPQVSALGITAPAALSQALTSIFADSISLAGLPFGLQFSNIEATSDGIVVDLRGTDTVYDSRTS
jgi:hypothetical protein